MPDEIVLIVNESDEIISPTTRTEAVASHHWRRASGGIVFDPSLDLVLCHRRSKEKDERPGVWVSTFGGKVRAAETVADAARRELSEEFGLQITDAELHYVCTEKSTLRFQFEYLHFVFINSQQAVIIADKTEVAQFLWISRQDLLREIKETGWFEYGYERVLLEAARRYWLSAT